MNLDLLAEGGHISLLGMGTVFIFLVILIFAMNITEKVMSFLSKYFPEEIPEVKTTKKQANSTDEEIAVAIACVARNA